MRRLLPVLLAATLLAGCGGSSHPTAQAGPPIQTECGDLPKGLVARSIWLHTSDGLRLYAATAGNGGKAVVLLHESQASLCGWLTTMKWLGDNGIRTVAIDMRGSGRSDPGKPSEYFDFRPDIEAALAEARAAGSKDLFLMGASLGGATTLMYAPTVSGLSGVVSLSGELRLPNYRLDGIDAVPKLRAPLLTIGSREDGYFDAADSRRLYRAAGSPDKQAAEFPGAFHGWDLLDVAPYRARVQHLLLGWLDRH
ncbi:MAG TPA: alpha/beta fold hydrolase [Gaiellaceae bacterium]|nr:alpha/beta fold hydrolase [Gaiellaceae bacterium]